MGSINNLIVCSLVGLLLFFPLSAQAEAPVRRALFVSVLQDPQTLSSEKEINNLVAFSKKAGIGIIFIQVYRSNQAWFPSKVADASPYERCFKSLGQDPVALLISKAHAQGIEVHAWLNLLSLSANKDANFIKKYGVEILTQNVRRKRTFEDYKIDNQYFLEPGDPRVREDLAKIVKEIVVTYKDLDGIQFDYIRYPDVKPQYGYTQINMERFKKATGILRSIWNGSRKPRGSSGSTKRTCGGKIGSATKSPIYSGCL